MRLTLESASDPRLAAGADALSPPASVLLRRILALAAPTTAVALLQVAAQLAETALAARQGTAALAGWAVLLPFALLMQQMSTGAMGGGVVSAVARALGGGRRDEASALVAHAVFIAVAAGLAFAVALAAVRRAAAARGGRAGGGRRGDRLRAVAVRRRRGAGLAGQHAGVGAARRRAACAGGARAVARLARLSAARPGRWPSRLGSGWRASARRSPRSTGPPALAMTAVVRAGGAGFAPTLRVRPRRALFGRILSVGAVACAMAAIANLTTILVTAQLRSHGTAAVAAYGIAARLEFLVMPLSFGVGSALTALVGGAVGAGDWRTARRLAWIGGGLAFAVTGDDRPGRRTECRRLRAAVHRRRRRSPPSPRRRSATPARPSAASASAWRCTSPRWAPAACAGRWSARWRASRSPSAAAGGSPTGSAWGWTGHFLGVALGITAYGIVTASGVRPAVWRAR